MRNREIDWFKVIVYSVLIVIVVAVASYKLYAPKSGFWSRVTGKPVHIEVQADGIDWTKPVVMGRTDKVKYISFMDKNGNVHLIEITDFGILEAHYIVHIKKGEKK